MFPEDSVIIWVIQRKQTKKGLGPPIPQPPNVDPDIPAFSKGLRIPLLGNPLPRALTNRPEYANHYPRFDPLNPNRIIQSPEIQRVEEELIRNKEREAEIQRLAEEKLKIAAAKERRDTAASFEPTRSSSRIQKATVEHSARSLDRSLKRVDTVAITPQTDSRTSCDASFSNTSDEGIPGKGFNGTESPLSKYDKFSSATRIVRTTTKAPTHDDIEDSKEGKEMVDEDMQSVASRSLKRVRPQVRSEGDIVHAELLASPPVKRSQIKTTIKFISHAANPAMAQQLPSQAPAGSDIGYHPSGPSPPIPRGQKPKSRIAKTCVNCKHESSMEWRNRPTADRNDCENCLKRRDKRM